MNKDVVSAVVAARELTKRVSGPDGELEILSHVSVHATSGEAVAVLGASGAGKSTLLGLLAGLDVPTSGSAQLLGRSLEEMDEDARAALRAGKVGFVFQSFQLLPGFTAVENVMLPLELNGSGHRARTLALDSLDRVGLSGRAHHYPHQLSGGEQQRVAIARAFAPQPSVLFADEPTGNLDQVTGHTVIELMFSLRDEQGATLIMVTHDTELTAYCDRSYRLHAGRLETN